MSSVLDSTGNDKAGTTKAEEKFQYSYVPRYVHGSNQKQSWDIFLGRIEGLFEAKGKGLDLDIAISFFEELSEDQRAHVLLQSKQAVQTFNPRFVKLLENLAVKGAIPEADQVRLQKMFLFDYEVMDNYLNQMARELRNHYDGKPVKGTLVLQGLCMTVGLDIDYTYLAAMIVYSDIRKKDTLQVWSPAEPTNDMAEFFRETVRLAKAKK